MSLHEKIKRISKKSILAFALIMLFFNNVTFFIQGALSYRIWYQSVLFIIIVGLLTSCYIEKNRARRDVLETACLLIMFISSWIIFDVVNGFNNFSFLILHPILLYMAFDSSKRSLGYWMFAIGNVTALFSYQLTGSVKGHVATYMIVMFLMVMHMEHIRTIMSSKKDLQKKVNELETLYAITKVLDNFPDLNSVLKQITRIVTYGIGVDACAVLLYSQETGCLELTARYPDESTIERYSVNPNVGVAGEVFRTGEAIVCGDLNQDVDLLDRIAYKHDEHALGIFPLEHHENRFGVLVISNKTSMVIDNDVKQILTAVASTVSMVVSNAMHHESVAKTAQIDDLTGLYNRSYFYNSLEHEVKKAKFTGQSVYVLVLDIDKFKSVNDTYGHLVGDKILENIGSIISSNTRKTDVAARYGGEEFAIILPNSCYTAAEHLAERIRRHVEKITSNSNEFSEFKDSVTLSVGIACYPHCAAEPECIVDIADKRMYAAKRTGGNQYIYE